MADLHRRKDEFLAVLSHELRNPLAAIINAVQLLDLQKDEDPLQEKARRIIRRQVGNLVVLVNDLLEVSRILSGRVQLHQEDVDARGVVEKVVETARPLIDQRQHELTISLPEEPIWLHADPIRLEEALVNVLHNAAKYTPEAGRILINLQEEDTRMVLRVKDNGIGIAPEMLPQIFDLFTQSQRALDRSQGGLGIGLAVSRKLIEMHGGTIEAHSEGLGQGSEFVVRLPGLSSPSKESQIPSIATAKSHAEVRSLQLLVTPRH